MFAQDNNIFYWNGNINKLFGNVNKELGNVTNWYVENNLSISTTKINPKTKSDWNNISLKLPDLKFHNCFLERVIGLKFLSVMIEIWIRKVIL